MSTIGVFMAARVIRARTGDVVNLWWPERPFLTSAEIDMNLGYVSRLTVTMEAPYKQGIALLEDPDLIVQGNILQVKLGYTKSGFSTPWYAGLMKVPGVKIAGDGVSITLEADGGGALASVRNVTKYYTGSVMDILDELATLYGWEIDIPDRGEKKISTPLAFPRSGGQDTAFAFIRALTYEINYSFWIGTGTTGKATLFLRDRAAWTAEPARRTFVMFGPADPARNQYPLIDFDCEAPGPFLFPGSQGMRTIYMDEDGNIVQQDAGSTTSSIPVMGAETNASANADAAEDPETKLKADVATAEDADADLVPIPGGVVDTQETLQAIFDERASRSGMQATGSSIGIPLMLPGDMIKIVGCSKLFDGPWGVLGVKHRVDTGGFDTSWTMYKNGFPEGNGFVPAAGEDVSPKPPGEDNESGADSAS